MSIFEKKYKLKSTPPKEVSWEVYEEKVNKEYESLLLNKSDDEKSFQDFFEWNPSFVPGAFEVIGQSGHYPLYDSLISQPELGSVIRRKPDFLWIAKNSLQLCPVFIEIEKPSKKMFTRSGDVTSEFTHAYGQLQEWQTLLNDPTAQQTFFQCYGISDVYRSLQFKPQYLLIYGRREEYEGNKMLIGKRNAYQNDSIRIMSFDRLMPDYNSRNFITSVVSNGEYKALHIAPTFRYRPDCVENIVNIKDFCKKIDEMKYTTDERKTFLKDRYEYWMSFARKSDKGIMDSQEGE